MGLKDLIPQLGGTVSTLPPLPVIAEFGGGLKGLLDIGLLTGKLLTMSMALEEVAREAIELPRPQRLALARLLIELDDPGSDTDVEAAWEAEIQARLRAMKEGRIKGIPYEQVLARVDRRLAT